MEYHIFITHDYRGTNQPSSKSYIKETTEHQEWSHIYSWNPEKQWDGWLLEGRNHIRNEKDMGRTVDHNYWCIQIDSLEELSDLAKEVEHIGVLIFREDGIEIYDGLME